MKTDRSLQSVSCYTRRSFSYSLFFFLLLSYFLYGILEYIIHGLWLLQAVFCSGGKTAVRTSAPAQLGVAGQSVKSGQ
jgi:hypothetical protein